jgi:hypothetical protein
MEKIVLRTGHGQRRRFARQLAAAVASLILVTWLFAIWFGVSVTRYACGG